MATITFISTFNLTPTLPLLVVVDTSDYAGQGISTANVNGCLTVISPSGSTIYANSDFSDNGCDIKVSASTTNQIPIFLPFTGVKLVEQGTYTILYTVKDITSAPVEYTKTNVYDNEYISPVVHISQIANVIGQLWSQTDETDYVVNSVAPSVLTRTNTLIYPPGIPGGPPANVTTAAATLRTTIFFNGPQTSTVSTVLSYTYTDGLIVTDTVFGSKVKIVDGAFYCSIACGFKTFVKKMARYKCSDIAAFEANEDNLLLLISYKVSIDMLLDCGADDNDVSDFLCKINDIIGDCNCGCDDDDEFSRITGWGTLIGADGADGANGSSAYAIAVINGFVGTEAQWLASLVGTNGVDGVSVLYNDFAGTAHTGAFATLNSYLLPANTLTQAGDIISIDGSITQALVSGKSGHLKLEIGGADAMPSMSAFGYLYIDNPGVYTTFHAEFTRLTATTISVKYSVTVSFGQPFGAIRLTEFFESTITVNNLTSATNLIDLQGSTTGSNTLTCNQMVVTYYKKS